MEEETVTILPIFVYSVTLLKTYYLNDNEDITTLKTSMLCPTSCSICFNMPKETMYYPSKVIKYALSPSKIEALNDGTVLMGNLEEIG